MRRLYTRLRRNIKVFWGQKKRDIDVRLLNRSYLIYTSELPSSHDLHAPYCRIVRLLRLGYPVAIALLSEQTEYESRYVLGYYWLVLQERRGDRKPRLINFETTFHEFAYASHVIPSTI